MLTNKRQSLVSTLKECGKSRDLRHHYIFLFIWPYHDPWWVRNIYFLFVLIDLFFLFVTIRWVQYFQRYTWPHILKERHVYIYIQTDRLVPLEWNITLKSENVKKCTKLLAILVFWNFENCTTFSIQVVQNLAYLPKQTNTTFVSNRKLKLKNALFSNGLLFKVLDNGEKLLTNCFSCIFCINCVQHMYLSMNQLFRYSFLCHIVQWSMFLLSKIFQ